MRGFLVVACGVLAAAGAAAGPEIAPEARAVLAAAVETMGGDSALAAVKGGRFVYSGTYKAGVFESPFTSELLWVSPDNLRWRLESPGFRGAMGIDAGRPWTAFMAPPARCAGAERAAMEEWLLHQELLLVRPLLLRDDVAISLLEAKEGQARVGVAFERGLRFELGFSVDHGKTTLLSIEGEMSLERGRRGRMKAVYSAPKAFGPVTLPSKVVMETFDGDRLRETLSETLLTVDWNPAPEEGAFRMPVLTVKLDEPAIEELPGCTALVTMHRGPYTGLGEAMARAATTAGELGYMVAGPAIVTFHDDPATVEDPADLRSEIAVPVMLLGSSPPEKLPEGFAVRPLPAVRAAVIHRRGPYGKEEGALIAKLFAWIGEQGHTPAGPPRIAYYHDPAGTEPEDQVCRVEIPLAGK